jgi:hypothetical protein
VSDPYFAEVDYIERLGDLPEHMRSAMQEWVEYGQRRERRGRFMIALLSNDLLAAVAHADETNLAALRAYMLYLRNDAPPLCFGSPERVRDWRGIMPDDRL